MQPACSQCHTAWDELRGLPGGGATRYCPHCRWTVTLVGNYNDESLMRTQDLQVARTKAFDDQVNAPKQRFYLCPPHVLPLVDELQVSVDTIDALKRCNIFYIGDLTQRTAENLRDEGLTTAQVTDLTTALATRGQALGMRLEDWPPQAKSR